MIRTLVALLFGGFVFYVLLMRLRLPPTAPACSSALYRLWLWARGLKHPTLPAGRAALILGALACAWLSYVVLPFQPLDLPGLLAAPLNGRLLPATALAAFGSAAAAWAVFKVSTG